MKHVNGKPRYIKVLKKPPVGLVKPPVLPTLTVVVEAAPPADEAPPAPDNAEQRVIIALGDKWDLLASAGWSIRDVITDALDNDGTYITEVKGIGPATVKKIQEAANVS